MTATPLLPPVAGGKPILDTIHCCKAEDLLTALPSGCIDLIVTSPPYDNLRTYKGFTWDFELIARESYRVLKTGGVLVWVVGDSVVNGSETLTSMRQALYFVDTVGFRMHDTMIWRKPVNPGICGKRYEQVFEFMFIFSKDEPLIFHPIQRVCVTAGTQRTKTNRRNGYKTDDGKVIVKSVTNEQNVWYMQTDLKAVTGAGEHPAVFPEELARRHILTWSNPGDLVLDPFMGSGTTAKIARALGRNYLGCDISLEYVKLCRERLSIPYTLPLPLPLPQPAPVAAPTQRALAGMEAD